MNDKKVLIVDFDAESLITMSNLVYEEGFQAETATDGLVAYEKFKSGQFDLIILEPMLPKLHGFELCKRIVNDPEKRIPVIIVTAIYREPSCKHDALTVNGAAAFFTKPYNREELRSKILQLLVEGRNGPQPKAEAPAVAPAPPKPHAAPHAGFSPTNTKGPKLDLRELLEVAPAPREVRSAKPVVDIEKELQDAVSGLVGPSKKKETTARKEPDLLAVKEEFRQLREKREAKIHGERDIETLLKDAIGGLAAPPKKVTDIPKREPVVKPAPSPRSEPRISQVEKIQVAEQIKQHLPFQPGKANNVPHRAARPELSRTAVPFDIDKTLIEIDQIPLNDTKPAHEESRSPAASLPAVKKSTMFEEFEEPARSKPKAAVIGAVAGILILASAGFLVLKPKKQGSLPTDNAAATAGSPASMTVSQPPDAKPYPDTAGAELKPEPKKVVKPAPEKPEEIGAPIQPAASAAGTLVALRDQPTVNPPAVSGAPSEIPTATQTTPSAPQEPAPAPQGSSEIAGAAPAGEPAAPRAREGELVDLGRVDAAPAIIKKVEPKYPPLALRSGAAGTVTVNALISEKGDVLRTEILKGIKDGFGLEAAAETAIRQWKFRPARKDGVNVRVWKSFDITFKQNIKKS